MADIKWVDPLVVAIAVDYGIAKALREFDEYYDKFPSVPEDTPGAIKMERDKLRDRFEEMAKQFKADIINEVGELPETDPDDLYNPTNPPTAPGEPSEEMYGMKYKMVIKANGVMHNDGTTQVKFDIPGSTGQWGKKLVFKWSDGNIMYVKDANHMYMNPPPDKRKYRPCDGNVSEAYAKVGTSPTHVTMYYNEGGKVDNTEEPEEPISPGVTIKPGEKDLHLIFKMTHQACSACGWYFDKVQFVVVLNTGGYIDRHIYPHDDKFLIKDAPRRVGNFRATLKDLPEDAEIVSATMIMTLNEHEGIANDDNSGVVRVTDKQGNFIREISAKHDIKGKGYSKYSKPNVHVDFTEHVKKLYGG